jgi:hypothetical protein
MRTSQRLSGLLVLFVLIPLFSIPSPAQAEEPSHNQVYLDGMGPGFLYSLNYERKLNRTFGIRWGAGGLPFSQVRYVLSFGMLTATLGGPVHSLHAGVGGGFAWFKDLSVFEIKDVLTGVGVFSIGYQFKPQARGFFVRVAYTPFVNSEVTAPLWVGISLGWAF